jgi:hypothetical protein
MLERSILFACVEQQSEATATVALLYRPCVTVLQRKERRLSSKNPLLISSKLVLDGLVVSVLAIETKVRGFRPG